MDAIRSWRRALKKFYFQVADICDPHEVAVKCDDIRPVVQGDNGDEQIHRTGLDAAPATALSQFRRGSPQIFRSGNQRQMFKLLVQMSGFVVTGVPQDLESDGFSHCDIRRENESGNELL
jgi:hypothetical protein